MLLGVIIVVAIILSLIFFMLFFKKYLKETCLIAREDSEIIESSGNVTTFLTNEKYREYIDNYEIIEDENHRYLRVNFKKGIQTFSYDIAYFRGLKLINVITVKKKLISRASTPYLVNLPMNVNHVQIYLNEVDGKLIENNEYNVIPLKQYRKFSLITASVAVIPYILLFIILPLVLYSNYRDFMEFFSLTNILLFLLVIILFMVIFYLISMLIFRKNGGLNNHGRTK